jgi:hypothetical protein
VSFRDKPTAIVFLGRLPKGFPADLLAVARRKLGYLHAATTLRREKCWQQGIDPNAVAGSFL